MKIISVLALGLAMQAVASMAAANENNSVKIGDAEVVFNYQPLEEGAATLTVTSTVFEINDSLRGLKNSDQRRLSKLGQLHYQCKLLLYKPDSSDRIIDPGDPFLISNNYSLVTNVDVPLTAEESVAIQVQPLQLIDDASLFTRTLGGQHQNNDVEAYLGEGYPLNLSRISLNVLQETALLENSESITVNVRFPVFQLQKPVRQWNYSFNVKDFRKAIQFADENCTIDKFLQLVNNNG